MEWSAPPGLHTISAVWKSPDGKSSLSPDVKVDLPNGVLSSYWTFTIKPEDIPGVWTLEARVDGQPAGSHNFEIYVPGRRSTTDEIYRSVQKSLAVISPLDARGERMDMSLGFVFGQDLIATAFQSIDGASAISVQFSDGTVARADSLAGWNRSLDWALVADWQRREKVRNAVITSAVYDSSNRKRAECAPKKVSFSETAARVTQQLSLAGLEAGNYRVDIIADGNVCSELRASASPNEIENGSR